MTSDSAHVLILVQNLPVPFDRRVWQEAKTLREAGYRVSVICPRTKEAPDSQESLDGVEIYRYKPILEARRTLAYPLEYAIAIASMLVLALRIARRSRVDVVQACNPPDLLFIVALVLKKVQGAAFIFDHHDVSPELLVAKGHTETDAVVRVAKTLERWTFRTADVSIATNESYKQVAISRGGMRADDVFVVRSGPDTKRLAALDLDDPFPMRRKHLVAYVGVMGIQEGLDYLLDAASEIVHRRGRDDVQFVLAGSGPEFTRLKERAATLGLSDYVDFLGRVPDDTLFQLLKTADVCVNPDEYNVMNDISTMNKVLEYMAFGKPMVQFDLREARVSAAASSLYVLPNSAVALADGICQLLDDASLREEMGETGRRRFHDNLTWQHQVGALLSAYEQALGHNASQAAHEAL